MATPKFKPQPLEKAVKHISLTVTRDLFTEMKSASDRMGVNQNDLIVQAIEFALDSMQAK